MAQHIVGHADKGVFLTEHFSVFADKGQTVDIGINHDTEIKAALLHLVHDAMKVLLQWLGVVGKVTCAVAIEYLVVYTKSLEQVGQDDTTYRVDGVHTNTELTLLDSFHVDKLQLEHRVDMALVERVIDRQRSQLVDLGIVEVFGFGIGQDLCTIGSCQELTFTIKQLQGVPLTGIMRCGDDNTTIGTSHAYSQLCGRGCGIADIDDIISHAHQGAYYYVTHHQTGDTTITSYNDQRLLVLDSLPDKLGIGCGKLNNV